MSSLIKVTFKFEITALATSTSTDHSVTRWENDKLISLPISEETWADVCSERIFSASIEFRQRNPLAHDVTTQIVGIAMETGQLQVGIEV